MEAGARRPETENAQMSETTIKAVKARIVFTDGVKVEVESRPGTDPTKAITKIRELLDSESTRPTASRTETARTGHDSGQDREVG